MPVPGKGDAAAKKVVSHSLMKGVMPMGKKFWMQTARTIICILAVLLLLSYLAPTAC